MASLLKLYQQDVATGHADLKRPATSVAEWVEATKDYLEQLRERHDRVDDVPGKQKKLAAGGLNLAAQAFQIGASIPGDLELPALQVPRPPAEASTWRPLALAVTMLVLLLFNLWIGSVPGMFSMLLTILFLAMLHWNDFAGLPRRLGLRHGAARPPTRTAAPAVKPPRITFNTHIESVVRRVDDLVSLDRPAPEPLPPPALTTETLEFLQDMLEARITDDPDYAFKKISRTLIQVLLAEGIEVVTDAERHRSMFHIDPVPDADRAGITETLRPALVKDRRCIMTGYAQEFVRA